MGVVVLCGSRLLPEVFSGQVLSVCAALSAAGRGIAVCCCAGADLLAIRACLSLGESPWVFAIGTSSGEGFWPGSAPLSALHSCYPGGVHWLAGGPLSLPLAARLARRTAAAIRFAASSGPGAGLIAFLRRQPVPGARSGSWLALQLAASAGLPCIVFPCGWVGSPPPLDAGGSWEPCSCGPPWSGALRWIPSSGLFAC
jgi:hypothetical protein